MSYKLLYNFEEKFPWKDYENLTAEVCANNEDFLKQSYNYQYWKRDQNYLEDEEPSIELFRESEAYAEWEDTFVPIYNYIHILSREPRDEDILKVANLAPNVSVIYIDEFKVHAISLTGTGMDFSDSIELAYYILDGVSPVFAHGFYTVSEEGKKIIKEQRRILCESDRVYL